MADTQPIVVPDITLDQLTQASLLGTGVFDVLMRANKTHLDDQFKQQRITGPEYSTVYLGSLAPILNTALTFLLEKDKNKLQALLLEQQIILAGVAVEKAKVDLKLAEAELTKIPYQLELAQAQTELVKQQVLNTKEELKIITANGLKIPAEIKQIEAQTSLTTAQEVNLEVQKRVAEQQVLSAQQEVLKSVEQVKLIKQQALNAVTENTVLIAQECKLRAEFDLTVKTVAKSDQEIALLSQKTATERAQTSDVGVSENSVVGRQKTLYLAQTTGFKRDAEQKAAKIMADSWAVRRTTDEGTIADGNNKLADIYVGTAIQKMIEGIGA